MIKKLRRRYLATNMAILSCTLLVGLAVLFGVLYHSEVSSSYSVMQEMMDERMQPGNGTHEPPPGGSVQNGEPPEPPADGERPPEPPEGDWQGSISPSAMTDLPELMPLEYPYPTETVAAFDEDDDDNDTDDTDDNCDWCWWQWGYGSSNLVPPPFWDFRDPENSWNPWQDHDPHKRNGQDSDDNQEEESYYDPNWRPPDERNRDDFEDQPPIPGSSTAVTSATGVTSRTTASSTTPVSRQSDQQREDEQAPPPPPSSDTPPTSSSTSSASSTSTTQSTSAAAVVTSASTQSATSSTVSSTTTTTTALVPVSEGHFVPDAFVAKIGDDGSIESYAGNDANATDEDDFRTVHSAMDEVKKRGEGSGTVEVNDTSYRYLYQKDENGAAHLVLLDRTLEISTLSRLLLLFFFITLLGLVGMFFLSMLLANWTVTPIATAWEKQKQFVADASHELKTPLAVISANTEVVLANPQESVAGSSKWLSYIQSETMRMSKLITNLLSVARMDQSGAKTAADPISLSDLVTNTCMVFDPIVFEHGKTLNTVIQKNVSIRAEEDNIRQLLSILLDNAVLHSVPQAQITVSLSQDAQGKIRFAVANTANDIPKEQLAHLFDRFYRVDTVGSPNGSGLGLSIAKSIVHQMGGTLTVTSENQLVTFLAVLT